jgi:hypothetical protein
MKFSKGSWCELSSRVWAHTKIYMQHCVRENSRAVREVVQKISAWLCNLRCDEIPSNKRNPFIIFNSQLFIFIIPHIRHHLIHNTNSVTYGCAWKLLTTLRVFLLNLPMPSEKKSESHEKFDTKLWNCGTAKNVFVGFFAECTRDIILM